MRNICGALLILAISPAVKAAPIPVANFSFESPQTSSDTDNIPGWTALPASPGSFIGVQHFANIASSYNPGVLPPDGTQIGFINYGSIYQDLGVPLMPGAYTLSAFFGGRTDDPNESLTLNLYTTSGTLLATSGTFSPTLGIFQPLTVSFTPAANDPNLGQGLRILIANLVPQAIAKQIDFDVVALTGPGLPEPASLTLLIIGAGLGSIGLRIRRRGQGAMCSRRTRTDDVAKQ